MWIMLKDKLPTIIAPPKLSMFWSVPWPHDHYAAMQKDKAKKGGLEDLEGDCFYGIFGKEPRWADARKILFKGESIRVFPNEFTIVKRENMVEYLNQGVYELVSDTVAEQSVTHEALHGSKKVIYEEALVDGCNENEARLMAMGVDVSKKYEIPPIGWYRIRPEYGLVFCSEEELEETDHREKFEKELQAREKHEEEEDERKTVELVGLPMPLRRGFRRAPQSPETVLFKKER